MSLLEQFTVSELSNKIKKWVKVFNFVAFVIGVSIVVITTNCNWLAIVGTIIASAHINLTIKETYE